MHGSGGGDSPADGGFIPLCLREGVSGIFSPSLPPGTYKEGVDKSISPSDAIESGGIVIYRAFDNSSTHMISV